MQDEEFMQIIEDQVNRSMGLLVQKNESYSNFGQDKLAAFKKAAALKGITLRAALSGMMSKHTVSIYDMCEDENSFTLDVWTEKITDHINYLLLLKAVIHEEGGISSDQPISGL